MRRRASAAAKPDHALARSPPSAGWTLLEAAEALCPREAGLYRKGGAALDAAVRSTMGEWDGLLDPWPEGWLAEALHVALAARPDLVLTGRDLTQGLHAPLTRLPRDVLVAALRSSRDRSQGYQVILTFRLDVGRAEIAYSFPTMRQGLPEDCELIEVRIVQAEPGAMIEQPPVAAAHPAARAKPKHPYTPAAAKKWLELRVATWPAGDAPSTASQCLADAQAHFAGNIARDPFEAMRRSIVPASWLKRGPRS